VLAAEAAPEAAPVAADEAEFVTSFADAAGLSPPHAISAAMLRLAVMKRKATFFMVFSSPSMG